MTTRQIVLLEILVLANLVVFATLGIFALAEGWIPTPGRLSHTASIADNLNAAPIINGVAATPSDAATAGDAAITVASPTLPPTHTPTPLPISTQTPALTPVVTASNTPTPVVLQKILLSPVPSATPVPAQPSTSTRSNTLAIVGHAQSLPLSCEARSAVDWAGYFEAQIEELEFFARLPVSADNPELGFVGDVRGSWGQIPPYPYGVHAEPVAALLREYGLSAIAVRSLAVEDLKLEIDKAHPVIVWVTGHVSTGKAVDYATADGQTVTVAPYEHTVIVIGYTADTVTVLDGRRKYKRLWDHFLDSWAVLGNMAIIAGE